MTLLGNPASTVKSKKSHLGMPSANFVDTFTTLLVWLYNQLEKQTYINH